MSQSSSAARTTPRAFLFVVTLLAIVVFTLGIFTTPVCLNQIAIDLNADHEILGSVLFYMEFSGFLVAVLGAGYLSDRYGRRVVMLAGSAAMVIGMGAFTLSSDSAQCIISMLIFGAGAGIVEGTSTAIVGDLYPTRHRSVLIFSQVFFALGAVGWPFAVQAMLSSGVDWRVPYGIVTAASVGLFVLLVPMRFPTRMTDTRFEIKTFRKLATHPTFVVAATVMFLYVAAEVATTSWLPRYFSVAFETTGFWAANPISFFWLGILSGRVLGAFVPKRIPDRHVVMGGFLLVLGPHALGIFAHTAFWSLIGFFLSGLVMGPMWPSIISMARGKNHTYGGTIVCAIMAAGALGGAFGSLVLGLIAKGTSYQAGFVSTFVTLAIGLFVMIFSRRIFNGPVEDALAFGEDDSMK